jgi:hypothetical protein
VQKINITLATSKVMSGKKKAQTPFYIPRSRHTLYMYIPRSTTHPLRFDYFEYYTMDEVNCSFPTYGSVSFVGAGTDVSSEAGSFAATRVLILSYLQEHGLCLCTLVASVWRLKRGSEIKYEFV